MMQACIHERNIVLLKYIIIIINIIIIIKYIIAYCVCLLI